MAISSGSIMHSSKYGMVMECASKSSDAERTSTGVTNSTRKVSICEWYSTWQVALVSGGIARHSCHDMLSLALLYGQCGYASGWVCIPPRSEERVLEAKADAVKYGTILTRWKPLRIRTLRSAWWHALADRMEVDPAVQLCYCVGGKHGKCPEKKRLRWKRNEVRC